MDTKTSDQWVTPQHVLESIRKVNPIEFDPASNDIAQRYVNADTYCVAPNCTITLPLGTPNGTRLVDGLVQSWHGHVFCNPPYSRDLIYPFVTRAIDHWNAGISSIHMLVNSATETAWYQDLLMSAYAVCFFSKRLAFWKIVNGTVEQRTQPRYANSMFYFGRDTKRFMRVFEAYGKVVTL
jgi:hypothetical protein